MLSNAKLARSTVRGVLFYEFPVITDSRGHLAAVELEHSVPFRPVRYFLTFGIPEAQVRGEHAHQQCKQFLVCVSGSCLVLVDDGINQEVLSLSQPTVGVYVPPMVWSKQFSHSDDSTLLVFASHRYDPLDYIRSYDDFRRRVSLTRAND